MQEGAVSLCFTRPNLGWRRRTAPFCRCRVSDSTPTIGKRLCSIGVELGQRFDNCLDLGVTTGSVVMQAASGDLWHRRMGHINGRNMDALRKVPGNGVEYTEEWRRAVRILSGKRAQQDHRIKATYDDIILAYQLVNVDTLEPINPPALGGYHYVTKFIDQRTKWKEILLMRDKTHTSDSIALYNKAVVIPSGHRPGKAHGGQRYEIRECRDAAVLPRHRHEVRVCFFERPSADRRKRACRTNAC